MGRRRTKNLHLPPLMRMHGACYYYGRKEIPLGSDWRRAPDFRWRDKDELIDDPLTLELDLPLASDEIWVTYHASIKELVDGMLKDSSGIRNEEDLAAYEDGYRRVAVALRELANHIESKLPLKAA